MNRPELIHVESRLPRLVAINALRDDAELASQPRQKV